MAGAKSKTLREFKKKLKKLHSPPGYVSRKDFYLDRDEQPQRRKPLQPRSYC